MWHGASSGWCGAHAAGQLQAVQPHAREREEVESPLARSRGTDDQAAVQPVEQQVAYRLAVWVAEQAE